MKALPNLVLLVAFGIAATFATADAQQSSHALDVGSLHAASTVSAGSSADYDWFGSRLKFRGHHLFNGYDQVRTGEDGTGGKSGFGGGLELVLPNGIGLGLAGFTAGRVSEFDTEISQVIVIAELNYFLKIRPLRLAPFVGIHGGLTTFADGEMTDFGWHDGFGDLGYQYGIRFQPFTIVGIDAQIRNLSGFVQGERDSTMSDNQFLLGVTLF